MKKKIVYIDMDGVLADFDSKAAIIPKHLLMKYHDMVYRIPGFYRDLKPMPGAIEAFKKLSETFRNIHQNSYFNSLKIHEIQLIKFNS